MYRKNFTEFLKWGGYSPEEFYQWLKKLESDEDSRAKKQLSLAFDDFSKAKIAEGNSPNTLLNYKKSINKFLSSNELSIRIKKNGKKTVYRGQKIIKIEQVRKILDLAGDNLRSRALILTLKDSGLGVAEVAMLTCEDFLNAREYKDEDGFRFKAWVKPLVRSKTGEGCYVHLGPDAIAALEDYIGRRKEGPIFITTKGQPHRDDQGKIGYDIEYTEKGESLKPLAITGRMMHICKLLRSQGYKISAHSFRKLFETSFDLEGNLNVAKKIMGKSISASDEPYLQYEDKLTQIYMDIYKKRLSLNMESSRLKNLEEEKKKTNGELESLKSRVDGLQEIVQFLQGSLIETATIIENSGNENQRKVLEDVKLKWRMDLTKMLAPIHEKKKVQ